MSSMPARPERIRIGVFTLATRRRAQHLVARHVGKVQIEEDDVVVVELAEIDALFAEIGRVDVEALGLEHQLDALRGGAVVFDQQYAHAKSPSSPRGLRSARRMAAPRKRLGTN